MIFEQQQCISPCGHYFSLQLVPFILFILFYAGFSFGYGNVPFALMGELFPPSVSNMANTYVTSNSKYYYNKEMFKTHKILCIQTKTLLTYIL